MDNLFTPMLSYIDPGSGSLMLQMILASCAGVILFFRKSVSSLFSWFKRDKGDSADAKQV